MMEKTMNAQLSNASIAILSRPQNQTGPLPFRSRILPSQIKIPSVFISYKSSQILKEVLQSNDDIRAIIGPLNCKTIVVGSSLFASKTVPIPIQNAICSDSRVNADFQNHPAIFRLNISSSYLTATRIDSELGWGMNLQFRCCTFDSSTPTCSVSLSPTNSPSVSPSPSSSCVVATENSIPWTNILIPFFSVSLLGCAVVFFRIVNLKSYLYRISDKPLIRYKFAY
eukprot:c21333_g2_i4.p1 GENE.c21333_g2_i4~~c21333_g2_i4.p1  ORF type:complete len:226 (+),score=73.55 c21333_g2_i4:226-903(+)